MKIAFNTANLVARCSGYRVELKHWGQQHEKTVAQTDEKEWAAICQEIRSAGYSAVEIWQAHVDPSVMTAARAKNFKAILDENGLTPIGMAGSINPKAAEICQWLGIPVINGGLWGTNLAESKAVVRDTGIKFNIENHPEKTAAEVIAAIDGGSKDIGVAVDTGWFGTQGADVAKEVKALGGLVRHVHIKDVSAAGGHATCPLGTGVVNLPAVIKQLKTMGYAGWYAWEDEPEERNPMLIAAESRHWIETQLS